MFVQTPLPTFNHMEYMMILRAVWSFQNFFNGKNHTAPRLKFHSPTGKFIWPSQQNHHRNIPIRKIPSKGGMSLFPTGSKKKHPQQKSSDPSFQPFQLPPSHSAWGCSCLATQNPLRQYFHLGLKKHRGRVNPWQPPGGPNEQKEGGFFNKGKQKKCCKSGHGHKYTWSTQTFQRGKLESLLYNRFEPALSIYYAQSKFIPFLMLLRHQLSFHSRFSGVS